MKRGSAAVLIGCKLALLGAWLCLSGLSAIGAEDVLPYQVRVWQTDDGLPNNSVFAIAQTDDGYLWVGTYEGLVRFDGIQFLPVPDKVPSELHRGYITAMCAGRNGGLWVACDEAGVFFLNAGGFIRLTDRDGLPSNHPRSLWESRDGTLWIGCEGGLASYREGKVTSFAKRQGFGDPSIRAVVGDGQGRVRAATQRGLTTLDNSGAISTMNVVSNWSGNSLRCLCIDRAQRIWIGSADGLHCLADGARRTYGTVDGLPDRIINSVYEDRSGQVWVGTYSGLTRWVNGQLIAPTPEASVFGDLVHTIFEDREGNLWVGARDGLYRLNPARIRTYAAGQGFAKNNVTSVCEDRSGTIWIATWGGGLNALQGGTITTIGASNGLTHNFVLSLREARDGSLWIGMDAGGGLNQFKGGRTNSFPRIKELMTTAIYAICENRQGSLWLGTSKGLKVWRDNSLETYTTTNGLAGDMVQAVYEDRAGRLWLGTTNGLSCWQTGRFTNFSTQDGLAHNNISALYEDSEETLWIGTRGGGLSSLKAGRFSICTTAQGLFSDEVLEILEDDRGYFWMSCRQGIFRVAGKELKAQAAGTGSRVNCTAFGKADGMLSVRCNGIARPAGWKGRDGRLWFSTIRGAVAVESRIPLNDFPPPVAIEKVLADGKPLPLPWPTTFPASAMTAASDSTAPPLQLPPSRGELEISYTALSLSNAEKNRFRYRLEGVDDGWVEAGQQRVAHYNNLAPGSYRFRVIACNDDGVWNKEGASLALVLAPHFWQRWEFQAALVALGVVLLAVAYRARLAHLHAIEALRIRIAANLHDDVGARLTKVAMVTESVQRESAKVPRLQGQIETIAGTTREIIEAMDEIVWTINPKNDTLENFANYLLHYAQEYFQNTPVRCRVDIPLQLPDCALSTEARHHLFMAAKEALNNVLKHSGAGEVRLTLTIDDGEVAIHIADDGHGFRPEAVSAGGNGLNNMQSRMEQIGGRFELQSSISAGTRIILRTKLT